jgi:hypothetical protein
LRGHHAGLAEDDDATFADLERHRLRAARWLCISIPNGCRLSAAARGGRERDAVARAAGEPQERHRISRR